MRYFLCVRFFVRPSNASCVFSRCRHCEQGDFHTTPFSTFAHDCGRFAVPLSFAFAVPCLDRRHLHTKYTRTLKVTTAAAVIAAICAHPKGGRNKRADNQAPEGYMMMPLTERDAKRAHLELRTSSNLHVFGLGVCQCERFSRSEHSKLGRIIKRLTHEMVVVFLFASLWFFKVFFLVAGFCSRSYSSLFGELRIVRCIEKRHTLTNGMRTEKPAPKKIHVTTEYTSLLYAFEHNRGGHILCGRRSLCVPNELKSGKKDTVVRCAQPSNQRSIRVFIFSRT